MDIRKIKKLIELIDETGVTEIEVSEGEESLRISKTPPQQLMQQVTIPDSQGVESMQPVAITQLPQQSHSQPEAPEEKPEKPRGHLVKSPMVGTMFRSSSPETPPFVDVGQKVAVGDTLCIIEAMKAFKHDLRLQVAE